MNTTEKRKSLFTELSIEESVDVRGGGITAQADFTGIIFAMGAGQILTALGFPPPVVYNVVSNLLNSVISVSPIPSNPPSTGSPSGLGFRRYLYRKP